MRHLVPVIGILLCAWGAAPAHAAEAKAFNLALFEPVQIYDETTPIKACA